MTGPTTLPSVSISATNPQMNPYGVVLYAVRSASGAQLHLQTPEEAAWYENRRDRYLAENSFTAVSDLQDVDRLLVLEILIYRWGLWMGQGFDYMFARVDENALKTNIRDYSVEVRLLKQSLGIDKASRDKTKGTNLADYVEQLLLRAKQFGYHRNEQYETAVTKIYELRSLLATYDRCDEQERSLLDLSPESIMAWIRENLMAPWDELSQSFRAAQKMWIREL